LKKNYFPPSKFIKKNRNYKNKRSKITMNSSFEQMIKLKREGYRNEIRKQELTNKMIMKRQKQLQINSKADENNFLSFLSTFKFMQNYTDSKDIPNKVLLFFKNNSKNPF